MNNEYPSVIPCKSTTTTFSAMKRTTEWIFSQEIPSDVVVCVGDASFALHKYPLVSKSGYIRRLVSEATDGDSNEIHIPEVPGGAGAFEFAAKFCYGINFEISTENICILRCVAEFLEMTESYCVGNLVARTELYLNEVALRSLAGAITVLQSSESAILAAENVKIVSRCVDAIAFEACNESQLTTAGAEEPHFARHIIDWWAEDLSVLRIDVFQRVIVAMIARGFTPYAVGPILMLYMKKALRGLEPLGKERKKMETREEQEKRVILETIVSLLPREKNALPVSFLSMLLRSAIYLGTTVACRLDLEKRMALQLGQAVLDDLLIPSYCFKGETLFDVDSVQRIMTSYLDLKAKGHDEDDEHFPTELNSLQGVGKLMESYLSEVASDENLPVSKMIAMAELIPERSTSSEDGMYRAIDVYLKAHPNISELERKKLCGIMEWQKLSREACAHAAQNDRLPVQTVVQVLFFEQQRLREAMFEDHEPRALPNRNADPDELMTLRRENEGLKLELAKMKIVLKEMEMNFGRVMESPKSHFKPPFGTLFLSVSKKLGRLFPLARNESSNVRVKPNGPKVRRHSVS